MNFSKITICGLLAVCSFAFACSPSGSRRDEAKSVESYVQPPFLQPGDSIGIMVISSPINRVRKTKVDSMLKVVEGIGVKVKRG